MLGWVWLAGCPDPDRLAVEDEARLAASMDELEERSAAIRDAVVRGDLPDARARAGKLASALPSLPDGPPGSVEALKVALADVSGATDPAHAAAGVGRLAAVCADCHRAEQVGGTRPVWDAPKTRLAEMARHAKAVDGLWVAMLRGADPELAAAAAAMDAEAARPDASGIDKRLAELGHAVASAPPEGRGAAFGEVLAMCAGCHAANRPRALPKIDGAVLPRLLPQMDQHFVHAIELQLAIMGGELDAAHRAGQALAETDRPDNLPPAAAALFDAVRAAADRAASAPTLADAARATGELGLACAGCHTASGGGPKDELPAPPTDDKHMGMHLYGAYWLGYGVYAPDERAWKAGAAALAAAHWVPDGWTPPPGGAPLDAAVHDLAVRAGVTTDPAARAALWGELLVACAPCHQQLPR